MPPALVSYQQPASSLQRQLATYTITDPFLVDDNTIQATGRVTRTRPGFAYGVSVGVYRSPARRGANGRLIGQGAGSIAVNQRSVRVNAFAAPCTGTRAKQVIIRAVVFVTAANRRGQIVARYQRTSSNTLVRCNYTV